MSRPEAEAGRSSEVERAEPPRIYVASLSDYNAGRLHGAWIDADQEVEALHEAVHAMLARSVKPGAEEFAIHDYEGFGALHLSEYEPLKVISRFGMGIAEHGLAFAAWADLVGQDLRSLDQFDAAYRGQWDSLTDYAGELLDDVGATAALEQLPDWMQPYVSLDVAGFARDLVLGGDIRTSESNNGGVWVFEGRL